MYIAPGEPQDFDSYEALIAHVQQRTTLTTLKEGSEMGRTE